MEREISAAIAQLAVVQFFYKGKTRTAEPHTLGYDPKGHLTLCAWQLSGGSGSDFRDFHIAQMSGLVTTGQRFTGPRPGYRRGDSTMTRIIAQL
jgi:predicted DNA-binding transcriptional regulator YafY